MAVVRGNVVTSPATPTYVAGVLLLSPGNGSSAVTVWLPVLILMVR